jgi:hypothetical protein
VHRKNGQDGLYCLLFTVYGKSHTHFSCKKDAGQMVRKGPRGRWLRRFERLHLVSATSSEASSPFSIARPCATDSCYTCSSVGQMRLACSARASQPRHAPRRRRLARVPAGRARTARRGSSARSAALVHDGVLGMRNASQPSTISTLGACVVGRTPLAPLMPRCAHSWACNGACMTRTRPTLLPRSRR